MSDPTVTAFLTKLLCSHGGRLPRDQLTGLLELPPGQVEQILADEAQRFPQVAELVLAQSPVRICPRYLKSDPEEEEEQCDRLHLCRYYLQGKCRPNRRKPCTFSHDILTDHNQKVLKEKEISGLNDQELKVLLLQNDHQLLPEVCRKYIHETCDQGNACSRIHVCGYFTQGECNRSVCKKSHNLLEISADFLPRCGMSDANIQNFQMLLTLKHNKRLQTLWAEPREARRGAYAGRRGRGRGRSRMRNGSRGVSQNRSQERAAAEAGSRVRGRSTGHAGSESGESQPYGSGEDNGDGNDDDGDRPETEIEKLMSDWFVSDTPRSESTSVAEISGYNRRANLAPIPSASAPPKDVRPKTTPPQPNVNPPVSNPTLPKPAPTSSPPANITVPTARVEPTSYSVYRTPSAFNDPLQRSAEIFTSTTVPTSYPSLYKATSSINDPPKRNTELLTSVNVPTSYPSLNKTTSSINDPLKRSTELFTSKNVPTSYPSLNKTTSSINDPPKRSTELFTSTNVPTSYHSLNKTTSSINDPLKRSTELISSTNVPTSYPSLNKTTSSINDPPKRSTELFTSTNVPTSYASLNKSTSSINDPPKRSTELFTSTNVPPSSGRLSLIYPSADQSSGPAMGAAGVTSRFYSTSTTSPTPTTNPSPTARVEPVPLYRPSSLLSGITSSSAGSSDLGRSFHIQPSLSAISTKAPSGVQPKPTVSVQVPKPLYVGNSSQPSRPPEPAVIQPSPNPAPVSSADPMSDQTPELCLSNIWKYCKLGGKCPDMHFYLPYRWQVYSRSNWEDIQNMESVEKSYCDPETIRIPLVNFETMKSGSSPVRRLSTASSVTRPPEYVLTTEWVWYWKDEHSKWTPYGQTNAKNVSSTILSSDLESIYLADRSGVLPFTAGQQQYELSFRDMKQRNVVYRTEKDVRRRPRFLSFDDVKLLKGSTKSSANSTPRTPTSPLRTEIYPQEWDHSALPEINHQKVSVSEASSEFTDIVKMFGKTLSGQTVRRIWRIQNPSLWQIYQWKKEQMKKASKGAEVAERRLFHGTDSAHTSAICNENFDWRICGTHGTVYGQGSYFARDASYSHNYSVPDASGRRSMFLARVLVGKYALGSPTMKRPPQKPLSAQSYDSCVDNVANPSIYVVFEKLQIYPEYVLEYKEEKKSCAVS